MQGIVSSGISIIIVAWCIKMRGPLFASVFYPLQLLLIAVSAYFMLDEKLYLGRYIDYKFLFALKIYRYQFKLFQHISYA
jgi:hypothetical protein